MSDARLGLLLFLLIPTALLIICLRWLLEELKIRRQLELSGHLLDAKVVKAGRENVGIIRRLCVTYQFLLPSDSNGSQTFSRTQTINDRHLRALSRRSMVTVAYLPDNPLISRLSGVDTDYARQYLAETGILVAIFIGCITLYFMGVAH